MTKTIDLETVDSFLKICREEIRKKRCKFLGYRNLEVNGKKISTKQALLDIGIMNKKDIWKHVCSLVKEDCKDISHDRDFSRDMNSEVFEFIKVINKKKVYIKLTLNDRGVLCISFHESNKR